MPSDTPSRRAMLAGAPAVAAAALAGGTVTNALAIAEANAAGPDPVFAAIKREREAYAAYCATNEVKMAFPTINAAVRDLVLDGGAQS